MALVSIRRGHSGVCSVNYQKAEALDIFDIGTQHIKLTPGGTRDGIVACSSLGHSEGGAVGDYVNAIDLHGAIDWHIHDNATDDDFVSPGDPHLVAGSRAMDAGELIEDVATDIDGDSRGERVDVGADHFTN